MKKHLMIFIVISLIGCKENIIYYEYENVTITRINKDNNIYFYYGKCNNPKSPCRKSYIKAKYSGFNSGMEGYLKINNTGISEIASVGGYFEKIDEEDNLKIKLTSRKNSPDHTNEPEIAALYGKHYIFRWIDSIAHGYYFDNVIYLSDGIPHEKKKNLELGTHVKAIYPEN